MTPALIELFATKCSPAGKLLALHLAMATSSTSTEPEVVRPRDCALALNLRLYEVETAWREIMKLGWISSPRPDTVHMHADSLPRRALRRPAKKTEKNTEPLTETTL